MVYTNAGALIACLPVATLVVDGDGVVAACNAAAERLFGRLVAASTGRRFCDLAVSHQIRGLQSAVEAARSGATPARLADVQLAGAALTVTVAPVGGEAGAVVICAQDHSESASLTDRVQLLEAELGARHDDISTTSEELRATNEELRTANDELRHRLIELKDAQEAGQHKDDFLAMLAHELRNPLAPIVSALRVIGRHPSNADVVERALAVIERQVHHQARLLDDLLDASRITRGRIQLRKASVELSAAIGAAVESARPIIETRRHTLNVRTGPEPFRLEADATRLTQVIAILLDNAAKYTNPGGTITLTAGREGDDAVVRVQDTGIGIPPEMQSAVFDLFTQVDPPIARSLGGLGIGLTLMKSLVDLHGGRVEVRSEGGGRGSEFVVRLPVGRATPDVQPAAAPRSGRRVLIIEDNADAREMLRVSLELDGHRVDVAEDGPRGVEMALARAPEVVLVDLGLPGLDGYEVARRIRETLGESVTLVALTGYGQAEDRRRTREAGFDAHFVKPVDPETLSRALNEGFPAAA